MKNEQVLTVEIKETIAELFNSVATGTRPYINSGSGWYLFSAAKAEYERLGWVAGGDEDAATYDFTGSSVWMFGEGDISPVEINSAQDLEEWFFEFIEADDVEDLLHGFF